jgi:hypothetical protein
MTIKFYRLKDPYGCFSNFSRHPILLDGITWPTTEHYFQAQKYVDTVKYLQIARAPTPKLAAELGRDRSLPIRHDWENVKDAIMKKCVMEKALQHPEVMDALIRSGNEEIVEDSPIDYYWGCGKEGTGKNMLGKILMEIREEIKKEYRVGDNNEL